MWTQNCKLDKIKLLSSFSVDIDADRDKMQKEVNLVTKFKLIFPNPVPNIGRKDVLTTILGVLRRI